MDYNNAVIYLDTLMRFGSKLGLNRIKKLLEILGNPQNDLRYIHIAGTNGKGSTASMCASMLEASGYKIGLFTSPALVDFRERIRVCGEMIPKDEVVKWVEYIKPYIEKITAELGESPTEFEVITAIAFLYFKSLKCDYVVLEVGLGGRFDATNVIDSPEVSVITSISKDHTKILGDTLEQIAGEKCGIIKQSCPVVSYPIQENGVLNVIKESVADKKTNLFVPKIEELKILSMNIHESVFTYKSVEFRLHLIGKHLIMNAITAIETLLVLKNKCINITWQSMQLGISKVQFSGRLQIISNNPLVVIDGAHNISGASVLANSITQYFEKRPIRVVMGMLADKDYEDTIEKIAPLAKKFYAVAPENKRALSEDLCSKVASRFCNNVSSYSDISNAISAVLDDISYNDVIIICGSLYMIGKAGEKVIEKINEIENQPK